MYVNLLYTIQIIKSVYAKCNLDLIDGYKGIRIYCLSSFVCTANVTVVII